MHDEFAAQIEGVEIEEGRLIILRCEMRNPYEYPITGVEVFAHVKANVGSRYVELAQTLRGYVGRGDPPTKYLYRPKKTFELILPIPVSKEALSEIESIRTDDVNLSIMGDVVYSIAHQSQEGSAHYLMGERRWDVLTANGGRPEVHSIPQSEWLKHLACLKWKDYEILEVPRNPSGDSKFARAYQQLAKASKQYKDGEWDACAFHCRKAYEAAMKDATTEEGMKQASEAVLSKHLGIKKERLNALLLALGDYTQLARHAKKEPVHFDKFDAAQVMFMTTAAVDFIANQ